MFEKVVMKVLLGSACAGVVTCVGYMVYSLVSMIASDRRENKEFNDLMERKNRYYSLMEEEILRRMSAEQE